MKTRETKSSYRVVIPGQKDAKSDAGWFASAVRFRYDETSLWATSVRGGWAIGAVGSALPSHGRGHRFESGIAHTERKTRGISRVFLFPHKDTVIWPSGRLRRGGGRFANSTGSPGSRSRNPAMSSTQPLLWDCGAVAFAPGNGRAPGADPHRSSAPESSHAPRRVGGGHRLGWRRNR
jgi:hypothetical protein